MNPVGLLVLGIIVLAFSIGIDAPSKWRHVTGVTAPLLIVIAMMMMHDSWQAIVIAANATVIVHANAQRVLDKLDAWATRSRKPATSSTHKHAAD